MIQITKDKDGTPVGWSLNPQTEEEHEIAGTIRDLTFFGINDTRIVYDGIELIDPSKGKCFGNVKTVKWIQQKHKNQ